MFVWKHRVYRQKVAAFINRPFSSLSICLSSCPWVSKLSEGLVEMFEHEFADTCADKFLLGPNGVSEVLHVRRTQSAPPEIMLNHFQLLHGA